MKQLRNEVAQLHVLHLQLRSVGQTPHFIPVLRCNIRFLHLDNAWQQTLRGSSKRPNLDEGFIPFAVQDESHIFANVIA